MNNSINYIINNFRNKNIDEYILDCKLTKPIKNFFIAISKFYENNIFIYNRDIEMDNLDNILDDIIKCPLSQKYFFEIYKLIPIMYMTCYTNKNSKNLLIKTNEIINKSFNFIKDDVKFNLNNKRIKILFIDFYMLQKGTYSSVFKDRSEIIKRLDNNIFEKHFLFSANVNELFKNQKILSFLQCFDNVLNVEGINLKDGFDKIINQLKSLSFDITIYPSIGMHPFSNIFANNRISPIQINTWGHSITSGIDTIDYYISSKLYETEDASKNYSEKLIKLDSLCTYYINEIEEFHVKLKNRNSLELPKDKKIIFLMFTNQKFNLNFLDILEKIVSKTDNILFLMSDSFNNNQKNIINSKLKYVKYIKFCSHYLYCSYMNCSDIVLDTYPFGGCNSSLEALSLGKIVITMPSKYLPGRFTFGFYKKMNIMEPIAYNSNEYINKTIKYLTDENSRKEIEKKIKLKKNILFEDDDSVKNWQEMLINIYNEKKNKQIN